MNTALKFQFISPICVTLTESTIRTVNKNAKSFLDNLHPTIKSAGAEELKNIFLNRRLVLLARDSVCTVLQHLGCEYKPQVITIEDKSYEFQAVCLIQSDSQELGFNWIINKSIVKNKNTWLFPVYVFDHELSDLEIKCVVYPVIQVKDTHLVPYSKDEVMLSGVNAAMLENTKAQTSYLLNIKTSD